jgi:hypothetical protein
MTTVKRPPAAATRAPAGFRMSPDHVDNKNPSDGVRRLPYEAPSGPLVRCVVARGRTVEAPDPVEKHVVGYDANEKKYGEAAVCRRYGPGESLMLSESEADRIRLLGFIEDKDDELIEQTTNGSAL